MGAVWVSRFCSPPRCSWEKGLDPLRVFEGERKCPPLLDGNEMAPVARHVTQSRRPLPECSERGPVPSQPRSPHRPIRVPSLQERSLEVLGIKTALRVPKMSITPDRHTYFDPDLGVKHLYLKGTGIFL